MRFGINAHRLQRNSAVTVNVESIEGEEVVVQLISPLVSEMQSPADVCRGLVDNCEEDNTSVINKALVVLASSVCQQQQQTHPQQIYANLSEIMSASKKYDSNQKIYATAVYDNIADSTEELAFRRGDILEVLERDTNGMVGWWLCLLRGRKGICPGNRLQEIRTYDSGCYSMSPASSPCPSSIGSSTMSLLNSSLSMTTSPSLSSQQELIYENTLHLAALQRQDSRRSWQLPSNQTLVPSCRHGDVNVFLPGGHRRTQRSLNRETSIYQNQNMSLEDAEAYDVPRASLRVSSASAETPTPTSTMSNHKVFSVYAPNGRIEECYDTPRPTSHLTPSSSNSSLLTSDSFSLSSSTRSSLANMPDYDIPRRNPIPVRGTSIPNSSSSLGSSLSLSQHARIDFPDDEFKALPLELGSALETLANLQTEATSAVHRLLSFVGANWRTRERLEPNVLDLKLAAIRLRHALHNLTAFASGALANTIKSEDKGLAIKLKPLVRTLRDADKLVHESSFQLDRQNWDLESLVRVGENMQFRDSLDQLVACSQTLTEDIRQTTSFIQGNAPLLFKRIISPAASEWQEDNDYVSLESKEACARKRAEIRQDLRPDLQRNFDRAVEQSDSVAMQGSMQLGKNDRTLLEYYAQQTVTHIKYLNQAIDGMLQTVEHNQPPKHFLAHGKLVVLSAHNLVSIGDVVHRNVEQPEVKNRVLKCSNALNDALKECVAKTKRAALQFPSVNAVQEMVDSVTEISKSAKELKGAMLESAARAMQSAVAAS